MNGRLIGLVLLSSAVLGCDTGPAKPVKKGNSFPGVELSVVAVGDPAILDTLQPECSAWSSETGAKVKVVTQAVAPGKIGPADVVIFPADRLGELVDHGDLSLILDSTVRPPIPLDQKEAVRDPLAYNDTVPAFRDLVPKYGEDRLGIALGGSALVLVYRRDAFESEANRKAAQAAGISLEPPKTWEDLDALIQFFHKRDWDGDGQVESGIAMAFGGDKEGVGDAIFLDRAASLGLHPDHYALLFDADTLAPRVASPPFVEALKGVSGWWKFAPEGSAKLDAEGARKAFREGETALLIDLAERASRWTDRKHPSAVAVAALPGSRRVFDPDRKAWLATSTLNRPMYLPGGGGWLVGVHASASADGRDAAIALARNLAGPESCRNLVASRSFPLVPIRGAQLGGLPDTRFAPNVDSGSWGVAVAQTVTAPRVVPGLRIPGTPDYLAAITKARVAVLQGESAETALAEVARRWSEISERLGTPRQLWHYRKSLNKLITDPHPPEKGEVKRP